MKLIPGAGWLPCDPPAPENKARKEKVDMLRCTLCGSIVLSRIAPEKDYRHYLHCHTCYLIFAHPIFHLSHKTETQRCLQHNNSIEDSGYVRFLNRVIQPALPYIKPRITTLDYGCGPAPVLSQLLAENQVKCYNYDPLFGFDHPFRQYDLIFSTECFEHFHYPAKDLDKIVNLLKQGGYLCIMTERWQNTDRFMKWYYKRDPAHVSFFHLETFRFISQKYALKEIYWDRNRVIILKKLSYGRSN